MPWAEVAFLSHLSQDGTVRCLTLMSQDSTVRCLTLKGSWRLYSLQESELMQLFGRVI